MTPSFVSSHFDSFITHVNVVMENGSKIAKKKIETLSCYAISHFCIVVSLALCTVGNIFMDHKTYLIHLEPLAKFEGK